MSIELGCGALPLSPPCPGEFLFAPVFWIPAGPKAASKPTTPVARMTDRNNGAGTAESRRGFNIPASKGLQPDCTAKHADAADCSDKVMAAQWRKRAGRVLFLEVLPVCNGRRQACERPLDGLRSP
jgi:hypothetical protein